MSSTDKTPPFHLAALGGTFDHFHKGHEHFLKFAAQFGEKIIIGITNQEMIKEKRMSSIIQPYEVRSEAVRNFCETQHINFEIVQLTDPYGPTLTDPEIDCLVVTELTQEGGYQLNHERNQRNLPELPVQVCSMVKNSREGVLNSTDIRLGKVSRDGFWYEDLFASDIVLTQEQREMLQKPLGKIVMNPDKEATTIIVVGDTSVETFVKNGWRYNLGIFDLKKKRLPVENSILTLLQNIRYTTNLSGTVSSDMAAVIFELLEGVDQKGEPTHLQIEGEEDLAVLPAIMAAPLESVIYYGQPDVGMVEVKVSEEMKERVKTLLVPQTL